MAWDDTAARQFAGGLANSYFMGYDPVGYNRSRLADEEMALRRAQNEREQAAHNERMRESARVYGLTDEIINTSRGAGLPIPEGQMGGDGFGPPTPAGLTTPQLNQRQLRDMQLRLAAAKGDNATITGLRQEQEKDGLNEGLASDMANWRKLTLEQKLSQPWVREQFNGNVNVPGELAITKDGKLVLTNADGRGSTKNIDPDLLDRAAAAYFLETRGRGAESINAMAGVGKERYERTREGAKDNNQTMVQLHSAGVQDANLGLNRQRLGLEAQRLKNDDIRANKPAWQQFVGPDGQPTLVDMNRVGVGPNGQAALPQGVKFPRQSFNPTDVARYRASRLNAGADPLEVDREIAQLTGGVDPLQQMLAGLKAMSDAQKAQKGPQQKASGLVTEGR